MPRHQNNQALRWVVKGGDAEAAFRGAEIVVRQRIVNQRVIRNAMEPRAAVADWDEGTDELTVWSTSQNPHIARVLMSAVTGIPEHKLRIISIDVGGGFGSKIPFYPEEATLAVLARNSSDRSSGPKSEVRISSPQLMAAISPPTSKWRHVATAR
jgi:carbon-monoxide dehydrogenase large subunit